MYQEGWKGVTAMPAQGGEWEEETVHVVVWSIGVLHSCTILVVHKTCSM